MTAQEQVALSLKLATPKPLNRAILLHDGHDIYSTQSLEARFTDRPGRGFHWCYWRIELEGNPPDFPGNMKVAEGNLAWSSPHRVRIAAKD